MHRELLTGARRLIAECECENGCPGCVGPIGNTGPLAKAAALRILDLLLEASGAERARAEDRGDAEVPAF
jgi:DEAD/DEAH box helicase domain-containing protein